MALPVMSSGRSLLSFRLLGVPVRVDASFVVVFALFGLLVGDPLVNIAAWTLVAGVSILMHEMGHALVARSSGADPVVEIHGMGGLTSWSGASNISRVRMLAISLAGPGCGLLLGGLLWILLDSGVGSGSPLLEYALSQAVYINVLWGALNLLPILPLDGGQVLRDLLPGDFARRQRTAAAVSVVIGAVAAVWALSTGRLFAGVLAGYFALTNLASLRAARPKDLPHDVVALQSVQRLIEQNALEDAADRAKEVADQAMDPRIRVAAAQLGALCLLELGRAVEAKRLLLDLPVGSVDPILEGQVLLATGQVDLGLERLRRHHESGPDERTAYALAQALVQQGRAGEVLWQFSEADPSLALAAAKGAEASGAPDVAASLRAALAAR
jgi:Zn-dependent protease